MVRLVEIKTITYYYKLIIKLTKSCVQHLFKRKSKMTSIKITLTALALLGLTACGPDGSTGGFGSNNGILQSSLDPAGVEYFNQEIGDTVLFLVDQSSLTAEATDLLNKQAEWLLNNPKNQLRLKVTQMKLELVNII